MAKSKPMFVVVRTYSAGVHFGYLDTQEGTEVVLKDARRIWNWSGANTLNEVATAGVAAGSKISVAVPSIKLTEAIEVIETTAAGQKSLEGGRWGA